MTAGAARVVLLTADARRHRYAAARLAERTRLAGVVSEVKAPLLAPQVPLAPDERADVDRHFAERDAVEVRMLGAEVAFPDVERLDVGAGEASAPRVLAWVEARRPDVLVLYGTSIIRPPLLDRYAGRIVNLHLGLSPYYRGAGTNFWPLVHREPECVGVTLHLAVARVDAGPILAQARPEVRPDDRAHEVGTRTLVAALELLPEVLARHLAGRLRPAAQDLGRGRVYRSRDFTAAALRQMWRHLATGMIPEYLADAERRRQRFPIHALP
jgi:folate-dependent phosphoribosylglycinamide formyltransferase PurN